MGSPSKNDGSLGRRSLGTAPRWLGLDCRPLAVKQQDSVDWRLSEDTKSDSAICFRHCYVSETPTLDSRHDLDARRIRQRRRHDHWLDDWNWAVWLHAEEPHGLDRPHPGVPPNDDFCCASDPWGRSREYQKVACCWSTCARSSLDSRLLFIGCIRIDGSARNCVDTDYVPYVLSHS